MQPPLTSKLRVMIASSVPGVSTIRSAFADIAEVVFMSSTVPVTGPAGVPDTAFVGHCAAVPTVTRSTPQFGGSDRPAGASPAARTRH